MDDNNSAPLHILIVEDSPDDAQLIALQLEQDGLRAEFQRVDNEADFLTALSQNPDLILSDYSLPQVNGLHILRIFKERGLDVPFILISGTVGEEIAVDAIKQGADDYLMKDRLARLGSAIRQVLEQKRLRAEKAHASQTLRESEARLRAIIETSPDGITLSDLQGNILMANRQSALMHGYDNPNDIIGMHILDLIVPEDRPAMIELSRSLLSTGKGPAREFRLLRRDGSTIRSELRSSIVTNGKGNPQAIISVIRDITERKQAEEELRQAEVKYRTLAEKIPPIVYVTGLHQHIGVTYISPRIEILGFSQEEWIADPELWFRQIHSEDQEKVRADIQKCIDTGKAFKSEYRLVARDGAIKWFLDEAMHVLDDNGTPIFRQGFMLDITDRKHAEEALSSRERYLSLLNEMTRTVLFSNDYDSTMHTLAVNMKKIIDADDCYLLRWDEEKKLPIPVVTTAKLDFPFTEAAAYPEELSITGAILRVGHVVVIEDVYNSQDVNVEIVKRYPIKSIIGIPLIAGDQKLGVAIIAFNSYHSFTDEELNRAEQAGNQVALALLEFQQTLEIQRRLKESNALTEISRALSETERVGIDKVLQLIVDSARDLIQQADESVIHLLDADAETLIPKAVSGFTPGTKASERPRMGLKEGVAGHVIVTGESIKIGDINASSLYVHKETSPTYLSLLVAPVQSGGQPIGTISVQSSRKDAFSASDAKLLDAFSVQAAIAIENTRLFEATQQSLKEVNALYRTIQGLASSLDTDELIEDVVNLLQQNFGYYHVQVYLLDPLNGDAVLKSGSGETGARMLEAKTRLPGGTGIVNHVVETALPFVSNNVNDIVFFYRSPLLPDTQSEMTVPIKVDGKVVGVIDIQERPPNRLTDNDLQLMVAVADQLSVALQKANLYANLQNALEQEQMIRSQLIQSERLALVGRLLASVSHELNNPLQAIQNALFLLKAEENLSPEGKQDLDIILSEAERMTALIERLRGAYRPGRIKDFRPVELNSLIEDVHSLISTHMRQKQIIFEFHPEPDLPPISGMSDQIRQVVLNLFLNAIEVMEPGGRLFVRTQSLLQQNEVLLTVKDTGPGIAPDILPRIFDAFITDKQTGTGLGLTITRDIIEQHFGHINAENDPEGGAIFEVWLPMDGKGRE